MKNREKFRDEILKLSRDREESNTCIFKKKNVLPQLYEDVAQGTCNSVRCAWCNVLFNIWLDEEYIEPPKPEVDWSKVPVDTLVRVKSFEQNEWRLRYFKKYRTGWPHFVVWADGKTSKTVDNFAEEEWKYCELVEEEEDDK